MKRWVILFYQEYVISSQISERGEISDMDMTHIAMLGIIIDTTPSHKDVRLALIVKAAFLESIDLLANLSSYPLGQSLTTPQVRATHCVDSVLRSRRFEGDKEDAGYGHLVC